jgi:hypothetical protein
MAYMQHSAAPPRAISSIASARRVIRTGDKPFFKGIFRRIRSHYTFFIAGTFLGATKGSDY